MNIQEHLAEIVRLNDQNDAMKLKNKMKIKSNDDNRNSIDEET